MNLHEISLFRQRQGQNSMTLLARALRLKHADYLFLLRRLCANQQSISTKKLTKHLDRIDNQLKREADGLVEAIRRSTK